MLYRNLKIFILSLYVLTNVDAQTNEISRLIESELTMSFPSIYFENNSLEYAKMPYTVDSCFKHIASNIKNLNSYNLWRDSSETEQLSQKRIKKLRTDLLKYIPSGKIQIHSIGQLQKLSYQTLKEAGDEKQLKYLLSLNSVLDVSGAIHPQKKKRKWWQSRPHSEGRLLCINCWRHGRTQKRLHMSKHK
jgi:hypothetical protein